MINNKEMTNKELIKRSINQSKLKTILYYTWCLNVKVIENKNSINTKKYTKSKINPFNPISYIFILGLLFSAYVRFTLEEIIPELIQMFKYN